MERQHGMQHPLPTNCSSIRCLIGFSQGRLGSRVPLSFFSLSPRPMRVVKAIPPPMSPLHPFHPTSSAPLRSRAHRWGAVSLRSSSRVSLGQPSPTPSSTPLGAGSPTEDDVAVLLRHFAADRAGAWSAETEPSMRYPDSRTRRSGEPIRRLFFFAAASHSSQCGLVWRQSLWDNSELVARVDWRRWTRGRRPRPQVGRMRRRR